MLPKKNSTPSWRHYQAQLQKSERKKRFKKRLPILILMMVAASIGVFLLFSEGAKKHAPSVSIRPSATARAETESRALSQKHLSTMLDRFVTNGPFPGKQFVVEQDGRLYRIVAGTIDAVSLDEHDGQPKTELHSRRG